MRSCNFPFRPWGKWLALCWGSSLWLGMGEVAVALDPLPTDLEGYQRFWAAQTPAQRLQLARRDPGRATSASLLGDPVTLAEAQRPPESRALTAAPPPVATGTTGSGALGSLPASSEQPHLRGVGGQGTPEARPVETRAALEPQAPAVPDSRTESSATQAGSRPHLSALGVLAPPPPPIHTGQDVKPEDLNRQRLQRLLAEGAAAHARRQAQQAQQVQQVQQAQGQALSVATPPPQPTAAPSTRSSLQAPQMSSARALQVEEKPWLRPEAAAQLPAPALGAISERAVPTFPETTPAVISQAGGNPDLQDSSDVVPAGPLPTVEEGQTGGEPQVAGETFTPATGSPLAPQLLEKFPLLRDLGAVTAGAPPDPANPGSRGSQIRQQLLATAQRQIPLDPDQINVSGDVLSYIAEEDLGIAEGNAQIQLADGTRISGDRLLFYRRERRLRSDGPFRMEQPPGPQGRGIRQIEGRNLDLDIPGRRAQFESSLVILPGEEPGTQVFVRSQETTALLGERIFFEKATITTSPEPPITHYVQGDRVEVFPDDRVIVYDARVFAGGELTETGDLRAGLQIAYLPLFIYSLRDHQWVLPGRSETEGFFVKSSWAYRFDEYNFGGLRLDAIQKKGVGIGFLHDYILPIPDSVNYGRAQFYLVTEADQQRFSSRFRLDHNFDFYAANLFGQEGQLRGQLNLNLDNTYRPAGGRNDNADLRLNATFQGDLSTTTLNISRTGSQERGTYSFPLTLSHTQRYGGVHWLQSDLRLDYNQRVSVKDGPDFADARLTLGAQLTPPGWGGTYRLNYRAYSSSNGDTEPRRNFELAFDPDLIRITPDIALSSALTLTQEQQPDQEMGSGLHFFNRYELRSSLQFNDIQPAPWITFMPGSIDYTQVLYSTPDQESIVSFNPRLSLKPAEWSTLDLRYSRTFYGNNSVPFQTLSANPKDVDRINANLSFFTPRRFLPDVPPGYIAFEDDLPGELPIALTFPDDTPEDLEAIATRNLEELQAEVRNLLRLDATLGYDFVDQKWDTLNANFTWNTTPDLFNIQLQTAYDLNEGQLQPIRLEYRGRSSTTFNRDQRSGLDVYEPGISYALQAVYDPKLGEISTYGIDLDATIGTQWQNHWRFRLSLTEEGIRRVEVRRDLRDFELRLAYDPTAELLRLEGILVAFPSRPVGLTQERGDFQLTAPVGSFSLDSFGP